MVENQPTPSNQPTSIPARWMSPDGEERTTVDIYYGDGALFVDIDGVGVLAFTLENGLDAALRMIGAIGRERLAVTT